MDNFISLNIKHLRAENKLDQHMLGDVIGVSRDVVSSYERGKAVPKLETIQLLCKHFGISLDDFINRDLRNLEKIVPGDYYKDPLIGMLANAPKGSMETGPMYNMIQDYRRMLDDKDKIIKMLEAEIQRLRGEDSESKTA